MCEACCLWSHSGSSTLWRDIPYSSLLFLSAGTEGCEGAPLARAGPRPVRDYCRGRLQRVQAVELSVNESAAASGGSGMLVGARQDVLAKPAGLERSRELCWAVRVLRLASC